MQPGLTLTLFDSVMFPKRSTSWILMFVVAVRRPSECVRSSRCILKSVSLDDTFCMSRAGSTLPTCCVPFLSASVAVTVSVIVSVVLFPNVWRSDRFSTRVFTLRPCSCSRTLRTPPPPSAKVRCRVPVPVEPVCS